MERPSCCGVPVLLSLLLFALAVWLMVTLSASGCAKRVVHEAKLPADWPIPQLTLPQDIELKAGPKYMGGYDLSAGDRRWVAGFNKDDNWPAFIAHVEGCLKPLDYWRSKASGADNPLGLDLPDIRTYYSPDFRTEVVIARGWYFDALGSPHDMQFVMMITVHQGPLDHLKYLIKHPNPNIGPKELEQIRSAVLEPIT